MTKNDSHSAVKVRRLRRLVAVLVFGLVISLAANLMVVRTSYTGDITVMCRSDCSGAMIEANTRQYGFPLSTRTVQKDLSGTGGNVTAMNYSGLLANTLIWAIVLLVTAAAFGVLPLSVLGPPNSKSRDLLK